MNAGVIEGHKVEVEFDGQTLRARGTTKMSHFALLGGKSGDLVLDASRIESVDFTKPGFGTNGSLKINDGVSDYELHFKKAQADAFSSLYEQLTGTHAGEAPTHTQRQSRDAEFAGFKIRGDRLRKGTDSWPISTCEAIVDQGVAIQPRITATRVVLAGPFALLLKKDRSKVFLAVMADGEVVAMEPVAGKKEADAREFALRVNQAARSGSTATPAKDHPLP